MHLNCKRQAKQTYYICTLPIRIGGYESAGKNAVQATSKSMSNCVKIPHISCPIHIFYSKETFFEVNFMRKLVVHFQLFDVFKTTEAYISMVRKRTIWK